MNTFLDKGLFLLLLYSLIYITTAGQQPQWIGLYAGAIAMIIVGLGINVWEKYKNRR